MISFVPSPRIPKDCSRRAKWIEKIRLLRKETDWLPSEVTVLCSKHFKKQDIVPPKHDKGRFLLSRKAVPIDLVSKYLLLAYVFLVCICIAILLYNLKY